MKNANIIVLFSILLFLRNLTSFPTVKISLYLGIILIAGAFVNLFFKIGKMALFEKVT